MKLNIKEYDKINLSDILKDRDDYSKIIEDIYKKIKKINPLDLKFNTSFEGGHSISASFKVGIKKYKIEEEELVVYVNPKIPYGNFLYMLNLIHDNEVEPDNDEIQIWNEENEFQIIYIYFYLHSLHKFLGKHFARNFVHEYEVFNSKIKGKIKVNSYLTNYYVKLKQQYIPCTYYRLTEDILENQLLKLSVRVIKNILKHSPKSKAKDKCLNLLQKIDFYFRGVSDLNNYSPMLFNRIKYVGKIKPYKNIHNITKNILKSYYLALRENKREIKFVEFHFDMIKMYEDFISKVLSKFTDSVKEQAKFNIKINGSNYHIRPDFVVKEKYVFDAKYKDFYENEVNYNIEEFGNVKINFNDIHQMNSYLNICNIHDKSHKKKKEKKLEKAILVYPQSITFPFLIEGFDKHIEILGFDISSKNFQNEIANFHKKLSEIIG